MQYADHPPKIEKTEEEWREAACEFGEIGENCDFTSPRKRIGVLIGVCWLRLLRQADSTGILGQPGCIQAKHAITTHNDPPWRLPKGSARKSGYSVDFQSKKIDKRTLELFRSYPSQVIFANYKMLLRGHDLRHSFAVNRVTTWYQQGEDVQALLPAYRPIWGMSISVRPSDI